MLDRILKARRAVAVALPNHPWLVPVFQRLDAEARRIEAGASGDAVEFARALIMEKSL